MLRVTSSFFRDLLTTYKHFNLLCLLMLLGEAALGAAIILRVPCAYDQRSLPYCPPCSQNPIPRPTPPSSPRIDTEIDWTAYMQEVEGWVVDGEYDYTLLRGDTGPLVYPAGFLYVYAALRWLTGGGHGAAAIRVAQWLFLGLYIGVLAIVQRVYGAARPGPPWVILLLALSKRVHSLFVLRLFNDCWAMLFAYAAIWACTNHRVRAGCPRVSSAHARSVLRANLRRRLRSGFSARRSSPLA